jgi:hypothetical protein
MDTVRPRELVDEYVNQLQHFRQSIRTITNKRTIVDSLLGNSSYNPDVCDKLEEAIKQLRETEQKLQIHEEAQRTDN